MIYISPSVLACDFSKLGKEVAEIQKGGAEMAHLDVMDGMFVPNMSFGFPIIESLRKVSDIIFDVHLMIHAPERYVERFAEAGADIITFHYEAASDSAALLKKIRSLEKKAAISVKPGTPIDVVYPLLPLCDMVLVMTVEPGYGGQAMIPACLDKVKALRAEIDRQGLSVDIQVDGGINEKTAGQAIAAGANVLVAGSAVFRAEDKSAVIRALKEA
ncbi:MAG: ribulose-phosphate 3-epimerase [Clostridia bacterium]|nr:ribulose-phosphate 3-epimerase [Clostridia bacterium]